MFCKHFDSIRSILMDFDIIGSNFVHFCPFYSILVRFGPIRSILIHVDQYCSMFNLWAILSNFIQFEFSSFASAENRSESKQNCGHLASEKLT